MTPPLEEMNSQLQNMFSSFARTKDALPSRKHSLIRDEEAAQLVNEEPQVQSRGSRAERYRLLDEIDKVSKRADSAAAVRTFHAKGPARLKYSPDRRPSVNTKLHAGQETDHIPIPLRCLSSDQASDLIPELQGRLPIRVELKSPDARRASVLDRA
jgi:ATP-dependent HslUV protease ATP-binding subunit HslU